MPHGQQEDPAPSHVIVFDGICVLCSRCVRFVIRHDSRGLFRFAALQSAAGAALLRQHALDPRDITTFLLVKRGKAYLRSDAALEIARDLGSIWAALHLLRFVPKSWRDGLYDFIARHRYRWFGREQKCLVPDETIRMRFLD